MSKPSLADVHIHTLSIKLAGGIDYLTQNTPSYNKDTIGYGLLRWAFAQNSAVNFIR